MAWRNRRVAETGLSLRQAVERPPRVPFDQTRRNESESERSTGGDPSEKNRTAFTRSPSGGRPSFCERRPEHRLTESVISLRIRGDDTLPMTFSNGGENPDVATSGPALDATKLHFSFQ
jgi:hypothetical protein